MPMPDPSEAGGQQVGVRGRLAASIAASTSSASTTNGEAEAAELARAARPSPGLCGAAAGVGAIDPHDAGIADARPQPRGDVGDGFERLAGA